MSSKYSITLSARSKNPLMHIAIFLQENFGGLEIDKIDSIFAFSDPCRLYGGRIFYGPELTDMDLHWMYDNNIGYRIPLSNFLANEDIYKESKAFLDKHHREGNSVIVMKDSLAEWIKNDYPKYSVECSVTKEVNTVAKLEKVLKLYDTVVPLPEAFNTDYELLELLPQEIKDRVRLFLNVGCAYKCPGRVCYGAMSKINMQVEGAKFECSQENNKQYVPTGMTEFDLAKYLELGYTRFKLLRMKPSLIPTGY